MTTTAVSEPKRVLGLFTLSMISVSAIIALRNLPLVATQGWASVFYFGLSALLFFIPISLVCAELASGWPKQGGVYAWVKQAFGDNLGALSIWFEWIESVVWLPVVLSFIAGTLAFLISPVLAENRHFLLGIMLAVLWGSTFLNFLPIKTSSIVSSIGIIFGSIIPGVAIIGLGAWWALSGQPLQVEFSVDALVPEMKLSNFIYFTEILLGFAGIEVAAYHINETKDPQKTYPRATFIAAFTIIAIYILGTLAISFVVPKEDILFHAGLMQAFQGFFGAFQLEWLLPVLALLSVVGALALVNTWIIGPSKGLLVSAMNDDLPAISKKTNKHGSPVAILFAQGFIATALALSFLFMETVNESYFILNTLASQLILIMYFCVFISALRLRYKEPNTHRLYRVPFGNVGMWIIAGVGTFSCVGAFAVGFVPPEEFVGNPSRFAMILASGLALFSAPPFVCLTLKHFKNKKA